MKRWWISWNEPFESVENHDVRPNGTWPLPSSIHGWWVTGEAEFYATVCALVEAETEEAAKALITASWPGHDVWRFCDEKPADWTPGSRYPTKEKPHD